MECTLPTIIKICPGNTVGLRVFCREIVGYSVREENSSTYNSLERFDLTNAIKHT